jgi:hypothetical protein
MMMVIIIIINISQYIPTYNDDMYTGMYIYIFIFIYTGACQVSCTSVRASFIYLKKNKPLSVGRVRTQQGSGNVPASGPMGSGISSCPFLDNIGLD